MVEVPAVIPLTKNEKIQAVPGKSLLGLALIFALSSCQSKSSEPVAERGAQKQEAALLLVGEKACPTNEIEENSERKLVSFEVELENHEAGATLPVNYRYASLITSDQSRYLAEFFGCQPLLNGAPLSPGNRARGFLNFALPESKTPARIQYSPQLLGPQNSPFTPPQVLEIDLSR